MHYFTNTVTYNIESSLYSIFLNVGLIGGGRPRDRIHSSSQFSIAALAYVMRKTGFSLSVTQNIRVAQLDEEIASELGVKDGAIGLEMEVFCRTFRDEPLFYQIFSIPPSDRWINIRTPES